MKDNSVIISCDAVRMRRINESNILHLLHERGPMSRVELARELALDGKTLTNVARDLLRRRLVESHSVVRSGRGRPRENLRLRAGNLHAIGLHLGERHIATALVNLEGRIERRYDVNLSGEESQEALLRAIRKSFRAVFRRAPRSLLGVGMAIPGLMHQRDRRIVECAHLKAWGGVRVDDLLQEIYDGQVYVGNYTQTKSLAEQWFGAAQGLRDFLLMDLGVGIGCALVLNGQLQTGATHMAGEIGHSVWRPGGGSCWCGRRGCLETVASLDAVRRAVHRSTGLKERALGTADLARLIRDGNEPARRAAHAAARAIGLVVANLVDVVNPTHIILTGESLQLGASFLRDIEASLRQHALPALSEGLTVTPSKLGEDAALIGSAVAVLRSIFEV